MPGFNIIKVIEKHKLDIEAVAKVLFPKAKHPVLALTRILENKAYLDVHQLESLAKFIGVPPGDLFYIEDWHCNTYDNFLTFSKGDYRVILNKGGYFLVVMKGDEIIEQVVTSHEILTIKQFIDFINNLISLYNDRDFSKSSD